MTRTASSMLATAVVVVFDSVAFVLCKPCKLAVAAFATSLDWKLLVAAAEIVADMVEPPVAVAIR